MLIMENCGCSWLNCVVCLSEPGYHEHLKEFTDKHGPIARLWIGPYLCVTLADAKYVEVSKLTVAV
jgi:hypothetical protein